jgi:hypothetical protein
MAVGDGDKFYWKSQKLELEDTTCIYRTTEIRDTLNIHNEVHVGIGMPIN